MRPVVLGIFALLSMLAPTVGLTQSLITAPSNNGSGGVFMNLQPVAGKLTMVGFDVPFASAAPGVAVSIEVWTRVGTYAGFTDSNVGWTLTQTVAGLTQGADQPVSFGLTTPISLLPTEITAVYLHSITSGAGIRYTGTGGAPPQTTFANTDLGLFSDAARTGNIAFAGGLNSPRTFSGAIRYNKTLETAPANNGSGGVFLNLQPVAQDLVFKGFDVPLGPTAGTVVSVQVWTRVGSYVGFTDNGAGWTLTQTINGVAQGTMIPAPFVLTTPIALPETQVTGVYLQAIVPALTGSGIRYSGTADAPPQTLWSNSDLVLFADTARTGFVSFGGTQNSPRTFSGTVQYAFDSVFADGFED